MGKILGESGEKVWIMRKLRRGVGGWGLTNSTKKKKDGELSRWVGIGDGMISLTGTFPLCAKAARLAEVSVGGK